MILPVVFAALTLGAPPLTEVQQVQLGAVYDDSPRLDGPGLYALLGNAMGWDKDDWDGAATPSWVSLAADPGASRGEVFLIEGEFLRKRRIDLVRPGPWGEALTEWAVQVGPGDEDFAVVYFIDPQETMTRPARGTKVQIAARFYKLWHTLDMENRPRRYLTFVGRPVRIVAEGGVWMRPLLIGAALAGAAALFFLLRRLTRRGAAPSPLERQRRRIERRDAAAEDEDEDGSPEPDDDLPHDPAEALKEMQRRHDA